MRKNFLSFILVTVLVLGLFLAPVSVSARGLGKADKNRIECAKEKMRILAEMFDVKLPLDKKTQELPAQCSNAGAVVKPPKWFVEHAPVLLQKDTVWELECCYHLCPSKYGHLHPFA